jgi:hypothetical protein
MNLLSLKRNFSVPKIIETQQSYFKFKNAEIIYEVFKKIVRMDLRLI